ncbi:MAG TPA: ATP-binding protein, partial [Candidatus Dormibacteraeota bacterium]|nr:ATP-binding protein [Candidatus Dormibacteraeota bacterium]
MRISRLALRDFRRYRDLDVELAPGLTVVRGPNEAGKTTIQRALELALTRRVTSTSADLDALRPWDAAPDARPVVELEFTDEDEDHGPRTGRLEKAFRGAKGTVLLDVAGEVTTDPARADELIAAMTGIPTEPFFRSTASIRHHEVADLDRDEANLRDRLQASISGADRGTSRARKLLDRALRDLNAKGEKNPGRLKSAEDLVARGRTTVETGEARLGQLERDRDSLTQARERRARSERDLAERRSMLEKARQAERLTAERATAQDRYDRYRQAVAIQDELTTLHASHPSVTPLPVLRSNVERLRALEGRARELGAQLEGEVQVHFDVAPEPTWRPLSRWALVLVVMGALVAAGAFVARTMKLLDVGDALIYLGGAAAGIGLILALVGFWLRRRDRLARDLRDVEIERRLRGRSEIEAELRAAETESARIIGLLGVDALAGAESLLAR